MTTELQTAQNASTLPAVQENIANLPYGQQRYVMLIAGKHPFRALREEEKTKVCLAVIGKAYVQYRSSGQADGTEMAIQTNLLKETLSDGLGNLTPEEIERAFYLGLVEGKYGELPGGICQRTYFQILSGYMHDRSRIEAKRAYEDSLAAKNQVSEEKKLENSKISIQRAFREYTTSKDLGLIPHVVYDLICEIKGVKTLITDTAREEIIKRTTEDEKHLKAERAKMKKYTSPVAKILSAAEPNKYKNTPIQNKQKGLALKHHFDTLISNNEPLNLEKSHEHNSQ